MDRFDDHPGNGLSSTRALLNDMPDLLQTSAFFGFVLGEMFIERIQQLRMIDYREVQERNIDLDAFRE